MNPRCTANASAGKCNASPHLLVVPEEVPQRIPLVRITIDVGHAAAQAALQVLGVPAEEPHDETPAAGGEDGPGVLGDGFADALAADYRQARVPAARPVGAGRADGELGEGQDDAGEDVDDDLHVDAAD